VQKKVLVASSHPAFGDLLRRSLEDSGRYRPFLASAAGELDEMLKQEDFDLALADLTAGDEEAHTVLKSLSESAAGLPLVVFSPGNDPGHPWLAEAEVRACLNKPFYLPELLDTLDEITGQKGEVNGWVPEIPADPQELAALLAETSALGGLVLEDEQISVLAGELDAAGGEEIVVLLAQAWSGDRGSDLARYTHLQASEQDRLVYATRLAEKQFLALTFDSAVPFKQARAISLAVASAIHPRPPEPASLPVRIAPYSVPPDDATLDEYPLEEESLGEDLHLEDILNDLPAPDPAAPSSEWGPEQDLAGAGEDFRFPWEEAGPVETQVPSPTLEDTQPNRSAEEAAPTEEPREEGQKYTCILVPTLAEIDLTEGLSEALQAWLPVFCQPFDWKLVQVQAEPGYLFWTVETAPAVSPGHLARLLRQKSSQYLVDQFPQVANRLQGRDFWAPGFLLLSGDEPPSHERIVDFIEDTRRRQGSNA
jgi:CheY-like chemotaxis protein